tara:strand:+ start:72 stop:716 length:645 start_codon:yes stop_codon:yes gene_type:complete
METHPIENGFIPQNSKAIIVGTFPPKSEYLNNINFFFYSSVRNHMWNRMENIFPEFQLKKTSTKLKNISPRQNKIDKQNFCKRQNIGFLDIFTKIERKVENSSKDSDLIPRENILDNGKLFDHLEKNKNIDRICCTYKLAYDSLICGLDKKKLEFKVNELTANEEEYIFNYKSRKIRILLLFPATRSGQKGNLKDEQYKKLIFGIEKKPVANTV